MSMQHISARTRRHRLNELMGLQFGTFTRRQATNMGIDPRWLRRRIIDGTLCEPIAGMLADGTFEVAPSHDARCSMAVLLGGEGSALSMETAASRHGIWKRDDQRIVHVVCRRNRAIRRLPWARPWRSTTIEREHIEIVDRIPTTSVTRTICDLGRRFTKWQLAHVLYEASYARVLDLDAVVAMNDARGRQPGTAVVRAAVHLHRSGCAGTRSASEDRALRLLKQASIPEPIINTRGFTSVADLECDQVWAAARTVFEIDGSGHDRPTASALDARRDDELARSGWRVLRVRADLIWDEPETYVRLVRDALRTGHR